MSTKEKTGTTSEVANRLVELCRAGKVLEAQEELYSDDIVCVEPEGSQPPTTVKGKKAAMEKGKYFAGMMEQHHGGHISDPVVAGSFFSISWSMDVTMKGRGRTTMEEIVVYQVKNGKLVLEQFFYSM